MLPVINTLMMYKILIEALLLLLNQEHHPVCLQAGRTVQLYFMILTDIKAIYLI